MGAVSGGKYRSASADVEETTLAAQGNRRADGGHPTNRRAHSEPQLPKAALQRVLHGVALAPTRRRSCSSA